MADAKLNEKRSTWTHMGYPASQLIHNPATNGIAELRCGCLVVCAFDVSPTRGQSVFHYGKCAPVLGAQSSIMTVRMFGKVPKA